MEKIRQLFALPPEDLINWDKAVEAGRILRNVRFFHKYLHDRPHNGMWEEMPSPEVWVLPDGRGVRVFPLEVLGRNLGANVTQEDLDQLLPAMADAHERVEAYGKERYDDPQPWSGVRLESGDFEITAGKVNVTGLDPETFRAIIDEGKKRFLDGPSDRHEE